MNGRARAAARMVRSDLIHRVNKMQLIRKRERVDNPIYTTLYHAAFWATFTKLWIVTHVGSNRIVPN